MAAWRCRPRLVLQPQLLPRWLQPTRGFPRQLPPQQQRQRHRRRRLRQLLLVPRLNSRRPSCTHNHNHNHNHDSFTGQDAADGGVRKSSPRGLVARICNVTRTIKNKTDQKAFNPEHCLLVRRKASTLLPFVLCILRYSLIQSIRTCSFLPVLARVPSSFLPSAGACTRCEQVEAANKPTSGRFMPLFYRYLTGKK